MKVFRTLGIALLVLACANVLSAQEKAFSAGTWSVIKNTPPAGVGHIMMLSDGSVLAINSACRATGNWYRLVPDNTGSYANGTWVAAGTLPTGYNPLYFASQVLPSGSVVVMGGEYNACNAVWSNKGAMYNPKANTWATMKAPTGWGTIGDAQSILLPNGKMMLANCCNKDEAILSFTGTTYSWSATGTGKFDYNDEEGWTMLPGGDILTVDAYTNLGCCYLGYQIYSPTTGAWTTPKNNTVVNLVDPTYYELGPVSLLPNGTLFAAGGTTNNAIYTISTASWAAAPSFGKGLDIADGPAVVLPDGNLLLDTSPGVYKAGSEFFEWDGAALHSVPNPANAAGDSSYVGHLIMLPTGQAMFTDNSKVVELYTPSGTSCTGCAPTIVSVASTLTHGSVDNEVTGIQLTGMTQDSFYGDDDQSDSDFPQVRITDSANNVVYCRTHSWQPGVVTGTTIVSAQFDIPSTISLGSATLEVVTNGIPSTAVAVTID